MLHLCLWVGSLLSKNGCMKDEYKKYLACSWNTANENHAGEKETILFYMASDMSNLRNSKNIRSTRFTFVP